MEELLDLNDDHLKWVIKENLKKNRLIKAIPQKIGQLEKKLKDN
jgi:hypothetical protein